MSSLPSDISDISSSSSSPSSSSTSSFFLPPEPVLTPAELGDEIDSLPSSSDADDDDDDDEESTITSDSSGYHGHSDAEKQWRESLQQLELLLTMVIVPYMGKYFGRKAAYWGWGKYMEWMYPVKVVISDKGAFRAAGILGAASAL